MRERQPLDLADGAHVLIVDRAHELPLSDLSEILSEARRARATVILVGDSGRSELFHELASAHDEIWLAPIFPGPTTEPGDSSLPLLPLRDPLDDFATPAERGLFR